VSSAVRDPAPAKDAGAAVADFALVAGLVTLVFVAVVQLAVVLHVRNTLVDCASEAARYGALADRDPAAGARRARQLISADLSPDYAGDVTAARETFDGLDTVVVRVRAPLPVIGLLGFGRSITVVGHAVPERT
jgi:Flp pilus assembly pilin Flp